MGATVAPVLEIPCVKTCTELIGNVAKALVNKPKLKPAGEKANSMSPDRLYETLIRDLEHNEARDYLERVWSRKDKYAKLAGK